MDATKRQITKIAREVSKFTVRTLRADGVGASELDVLHAVRKNPGITQAGVCELLGVDKAAVARQSAALEERGYLTRRDNPADGRSRQLFATDKADSLKNSKASVEASFYQWLTEGLSPADLAAFTRILDILYNRCKKESKGGFPETTARLKQEENK